MKPAAKLTGSGTAAPRAGHTLQPIPGTNGRIGLWRASKTALRSGDTLIAATMEATGARLFRGEGRLTQSLEFASGSVNAHEY
jgi:hypothetical protein